MSEFYLTAYNGKFLGPIAYALGWIMDKIYVFFADVCHIESVGLAIFVFTFIVYLCMFPLTYKQQKFSVLSRKMQPELNKIQEKYKGKTDNASRMAMQEETQTVYDKYGISPTGSCVQLIIQMPILFALYRVFYNVPGYISSVKDIFTNLVNGIMASDGYVAKMQNIYETAGINRTVSVNFETADVASMPGYIVDVLYKLSSTGWDTVRAAFPELIGSIDTVVSRLEDINYIFILNISDTPLNLMKYGWALDKKDFALIIMSLLIPICSYLSQLLSIKMIPQADNNNEQMAQQMKAMNTMMPLMSLFICFTVPVGLGFYWIISALVRAVQQYFLNKHFDKINLDDVIEANKEKAKAKAAKRGERQAQIYEAAKMKTKNAGTNKSVGNIYNDNIEALEKASAQRANAAKGSMAAKANLVKDFNERNNK